MAAEPQAGYRATRAICVQNACQLRLDLCLAMIRMAQGLADECDSEIYFTLFYLLSS